MRGLTYIPKAVLLALLCALCAPMASKENPKRVGVLMPEAGSANVTDADRRQLKGFIEDFLNRGGDYTVVAIDKASTDRLVQEIIRQQTDKSMDSKRARDLRKGLGADLLCESKLTKSRGYTTIDISLTNVETHTKKSGNEMVGGERPDAIRAASERLVSRLTKVMRRNVTFGLYAGAGVPMGDFGGVDVPATPDFPVLQSQGYDPGLCARLTVTFPLFKKLGFRAGAGFAYNWGTNTAPGYADIGMGYMAVGAGGELQVFFDNAYLHRGPYLFGGATVNNETFTQTGTSFTERRVRLGATAGVGHSFRALSGGGGWTIELAYHATLSGKDTASGDPVAADYVRLGVGYVF
jgi:hypothetical protein